MCETVLRDQIIRPENNNPGENRNKTTEISKLKIDVK